LSQIFRGNFGAEVIKNVGNALLFYFPKTSQEDNTSAFKDVLECDLVMTDAHDMINARLMAENFPSFNYRISAEYGKVEITTSRSSQNQDLFGPAMNAAAKTNSKAVPNSLVIGEAVYQKVKRLQ
jgi:two-component system, OmpR family, response regulator ChvI